MLDLKDYAGHLAPQRVTNPRLVHGRFNRVKTEKQRQRRVRLRNKNSPGYFYFARACSLLMRGAIPG